MHPLDLEDRIPEIRKEFGVEYCNITRCCTEVCPAGIRSPTTPSSNSRNASLTGTTTRCNAFGGPSPARRSGCERARHPDTPKPPRKVNHHAARLGCLRRADLVPGAFVSAFDGRWHHRRRANTLRACRACLQALRPTRLLTCGIRRRGWTSPSPGSLTCSPCWITATWASSSTTIQKPAARLAGPLSPRGTSAKTACSSSTEATFRPRRPSTGKPSKPISRTLPHHAAGAQHLFFAELPGHHQRHSIARLGWEPQGQFRPRAVPCWRHLQFQHRPRLGHPRLRPLAGRWSPSHEASTGSFSSRD